MTKKGTQSKGNPYKLLYWMGGALLLLGLGVAALVMLMPSKPKEAPPYERTLLWLYDGSNPTGPGMGALIEESRQEGQLVAVAFPVPDEARAVFTSKNKAKKAQLQVAALSGRQVHHRVFLPFQVVEVLIQAFGGIEVDGQPMDGPGATRYITEEPAKGPDRALEVMLAISDAAMVRQPNIGAGEALKLAGQVQTDMNLMKIPEMLQRWSEYPSQRITPVPALTAEAVKELLHADPVADPAAQK